MNRILISLAVVLGGSYIGSTFVNGRSSADEQDRGRKVAVRTYDNESQSSEQPAESPGVTPRTSGQAAGAQSGKRDYRRELQYDSSILDIRSQLHGIARPARNAVMSSLVAGRIMTIHVEEGARVSSGDKLVSLDDRLVQAQVEAAQVEANRVATIQRAELAFKQAERRMSRLQQASLKSATAGFEIEEARSLMEQAAAERDAAKEARSISEANLKLAEEQLRRNSLYAPFDGVIVQVHQKAGYGVDPSVPLITIANLETLEVEMYVPMDRFGSLQVGNRIKVQAAAPVNQELTASVRSVSPVIDSASNTFRCVLMIDNHESKLPAGFSVVLTDATPEATSPLAKKEQLQQ